MEELDLKQLTGILWRKKFTIILIILIFAIAGFIYTFNFVEPMYKSTCTIILGKVTSSTVPEASSLQDTDMISQSDLTLNSSLIETYSELVKSKSLIQDVIQSLNMDLETEEIMKSISVSRVNNSDLLEVTATNRNPKLAKEIVKSVVNIFSENVKEIYNISNVYVIDDANVEDIPYNVNHVRDVLIFSLIGLFVSSGYVLLYNIIDNTVKGTYDIENIIKSKILITIPFDKKNKKEELITLNDPKSVVSETFRTLRTNVQFSSINNKNCKTLLITSCLPEEGKSYISANLSIAFAQAGKKVILVDSDMRRGRQSKMFNVPNENGLSNYISNLDSNGMELNWSIGKFIKETNISNLNIITAGNIPPNPSELLESERVPELIEELKKYYDLVIFDGAPILPITDSLILGRLLGNTMLVAVYNKTKRENLLKAKNSIENVGGKVIGITLNKTTETSSEYVGSYYYYGKEEEETTFSSKVKKMFSNQNRFTNMIKKIKSIKKRIAEKSVVLEEERRVQVEEKRAQREEAKKIALAEKAKKQAEIKAEKAKQEEERAKREAELEIEREKEDAIMAEEKSKQEALEAEAKAKRDEEERIKKEEAAKKKAEEDKIKQEAREAKKKENAEKREIRKKENAEKRQAFKEDFNRKWSSFKEKATAKKVAFIEKAKVTKQELSKKFAEWKVKVVEEYKKRKEQYKIKKEEQAKIREEERIKREEERAKLLKEKAEKEAELARIAEEERKRKEEEERILAEKRAAEEARLAEERVKQEAIEAEARAKREAEERIKKEEEERLMAEERAKKEAELAIMREQERIKREEERKKREQERAEREAERIRKEEELRRHKEEEKRKKEEERARFQEIKAARELELAKQREEEKAKREEEKIRKAEEAKYTDEYLEENLYPKTKFNKF